jgi:hypothetical protein
VPHIGSYPSIFNFGHRAISNLLDGPVIVEEKVDGSQFSMGVINGELSCRSKGADLHIDAPEKMFTLAIETAKELAGQLHPGWIYRGEYLMKPKHNTLAYERTPQKHIILYDINPGAESYLSPEEQEEEAARLGLERVPTLYVGKVSGSDQFRDLLETTSILGGQKIEGVVVKPLARDQFGQDKKLLIGKYVSEGFKEKNNVEFRKSNPTRGDVIQDLIITYKSPARWQKAVQHLREAGKLENSPRDIGTLIKEVQADVLKEEQDAIRDRLFKYAWPQIQRAIVGGLPEWWKNELLESQFKESA